MGIVGGAVLPPFYASISEQLGSSQLGYAIMIPCYLYILFYALVGHKIGKRWNIGSIFISFSLFKINYQIKYLKN